MSPKWIAYVLNYYMIWGFHSTSSSTIIEKCLSVSIFCLHFSLCTWCSYNYFESFFRILMLLDFLDVLNFMFYYVNCLVAYWFIIFDSYSKRKVQNTFWHIFQQINEHFVSLSEMNNWSCLAILIELTVADVLILLLSVIGDYLSCSGDKAMHFVFTCAIDHRVFFFLLHIKLIAFEMQRINAELMEMHERRFTQNLKKTRDCYKLVYEMSENMNQIFGWSQLILIMLIYQSYVTFLNYTYRRMSGKILLQNYG